MSGAADGGMPVGLTAELRRAAMGMVSYGWPVLRGTFFDGTQWRGRPDVAGLRPVEQDWPTGWTLTTARVADWWAEHPYSLLLPCGYGVDCLELPVSAAPRVVSALREAQVRPPTMLTPVGSVVLFVGTTGRGAQRRTLLSAVLRSAGSWIAIPPTSDNGRTGARSYQWAPGAAPSEVRWQLPELPVVNEVLAGAVSGMATAPGTTGQGVW